MSASPNLVNEENYDSLKTVLKWEIQHLLQRLSDIGEETLLLTVSVKDGDTSEMGSPKGQGFLSLSDLQYVKTQFKSYCQSVSDIYKQMEIYRDLSSGELSLGPKTPAQYEHRRKRRKKTYLQHAKIQRLEDRHIKQELSSTSDDNSDGNILNYHEALDHQEELESTANTSVKLSLPMLSMRSRRKRTPKKVVTSTNIQEDDNNDSSIPENFYHTKDEYFDNQSEDLESANFYVKKSQSMDQINENQSEGSEVTSYSGDFSINEVPYKQVNSNLGEDIDFLKEKSTLYQRSLNSSMQEENIELSSLLKKTKDTILSKKSVKTLRKSTRLNSAVSLDSQTDDKSLIYSEKSMPVFPNLEDLKQSWLGHENSMDVSYNIGETIEDTSVPVSSIRKDEYANNESMNVDMGIDDSLIKNGDGSLLLDRLSTSAEKSSRIDKQGLENSAPVTPSRKKGFKPVPADENPAETALLDASKLGVGRYKCPMCGQTTRDRHDLKRHLRTHTKEKPHKCSLCGKKFTRKWDLENHFTRHNKSERSEANSRMGKQFNKTVEASNSEVLTYEKLISKLLSEKNISVGGDDNDIEQQSENEWIVLGEMKKPGHPSSVLGNIKHDRTETQAALSVHKEQPAQEKDIQSKKTPDKLLSGRGKQEDKSEEKSDENSSNDDANAKEDIEKAGEELSGSGDNSFVEERCNINGSSPSITGLDSSSSTPVTYMNDT